MMNDDEDEDGNEVVFSVGSWKINLVDGWHARYLVIL